MRKSVIFLTLFSSLSTLICCALPALFVALGMGASLAAAISSFPQLIWFSEHKSLIFPFAGLMLAFSLYFNFLGKEKSCPTDPELAAACKTARKYSSLILYFSLVVYLIGAFFAFVAQYLV